MLTKFETNLEKSASMRESKIRIQSDLGNLGNGLKKQDEFSETQVQSTSHRNNQLHGSRNGNSVLRNSYLQKHQEVKMSQGGERMSAILEEA